MADRSAAAVGTLMRVDPDFVDLVETLYGPGVDAEAVWNDVFGDEVAPISKGKGLKALAIGSTLAGAALAVPELRAGIKGVKAAGGVRNAFQAAKAAAPAGSGLLATGRTLAKSPLGQTAIGGAALAGDADVVNELHKKPTTPVTKAFPGASFPKLATHVKGLIEGTKKAGRVNMHEAGARAADFKNDPKGTIKTAKRSTLVKTGAAATVAAAGVQHARKNRAEVYEPYGKSNEFEAEGTFSKFDDDKRLAFGWASVVRKNGMPVIDRQDDVIDLDELEKAAYTYVHTSRVGGDMHKRVAKLDSPHHVSDMVESMVITPEKLEAMGLDADALPHGWWVGFKVHDDDTWQMVKNGERTGFSIHGKGKRKVAELDEVMA